MKKTGGSRTWPPHQQYQHQLRKRYHWMKISKAKFVSDFLPFPFDPVPIFPYQGNHGKQKCSPRWRRLKSRLKYYSKLSSLFYLFSFFFVAHTDIDLSCLVVHHMIPHLHFRRCPGRYLWFREGTKIWMEKSCWVCPTQSTSIISWSFFVQSHF